MADEVVSPLVDFSTRVVFSGWSARRKMEGVSVVDTTAEPAAVVFPCAETTEADATWM